MSDARSQVTGLSREIRTLTGTTSSMGSTLSTLGSSFQRTGQLLTTHLTIPITLMGGALLNAGIQFEDAFAGVAKTVDGISDNFGNLTKTGVQVRDSFRAMALEIPLSVNEFAKIGEMAGQLGISASQIEDFTRTVALLGVTTELTSEEAATFFARFGNIMGVATEDMAAFTKQAGTTVVELGNKFAATEPEIAALSLRLAGAGQAAGLTAPQILAMATAMASLGIQSEMGGSALSRVMLESKRAVDDFTATGGKASDQLVLFAEAAGMTVQEFVNLQKTDPTEAILRLLGGINRLQEAGMLSSDTLKTMNLDTIRLQDVMNRLGPNIEFVRGALKVSNDEWANGNALQVEAQKRFNTTKSQLILLRNTFSELGITLFYLYQKPLNALIKGLRFLIIGFTKLDDGVLKTAVSIALFVAALGPILLIFGNILSFLGITTTMLAAFGGTLLLITGLVGGLGLAWILNFGGIQEKAQALSSTLQDVGGWLKKAFNFGKSRLTGPGKFFTGLGQTIKALTYVYKDNARTFFGQVLKALGVGEMKANALGRTIRDKLAPFLLTLSRGFVQVGVAIDGFAEYLKLGGVIGALRWLFSRQEMFGGMTDISPLEHILQAFGLGDIVDRFKRILESLATETWPKLQTFLGALGSLVADVVSYIVSDILPAAGQVFEWFATELIPAVLPVLTNAVNTIKNIFDNAKPVINWFIDTGIPELEKVLVGDDGKSGVVGAFDNLINTIDFLSPVLGRAIPIIAGLWFGWSLLNGPIKLITGSFGKLTSAAGLLHLKMSTLMIGVGLAGVALYLYSNNIFNTKENINKAGEEIRDGEYLKALKTIDQTLFEITVGIATWILASLGIDPTPGLKGWKTTVEAIKAALDWISKNGALAFAFSVTIPNGLQAYHDLLYDMAKLGSWLGLNPDPDQGNFSGGGAGGGSGGGGRGFGSTPATSTNLQFWSDMWGSQMGWHPSVKTFASGGWMNKPSIVGERGPELFWPGRSGQVFSNSLTRLLSTVMGGGGSSSTINNSRTFAPVINGAYMSSDQSVGDEIARQYRMAVLSGA